MSLACQAASLLLASGVCTFAEILACTGPVGERVHLHFDDGGNLRCSVNEPLTGNTRLCLCVRGHSLAGFFIHHPSNLLCPLPWFSGVLGHQEEKAPQTEVQPDVHYNHVLGSPRRGFPPNPGFPTSQLRHQSADCVCRPGRARRPRRKPTTPTHRTPAYRERRGNKSPGCIIKALTQETQSVPFFFFFFSTASHAHRPQLPRRLVILIKARCQICDADGRAAEFYGPSSRRSVWPRGTTVCPVVQMNPGEDRPRRRPAHRATRSLPSLRMQPAPGRRPVPRLLSPDAQSRHNRSPFGDGRDRTHSETQPGSGCNQLHPEGRPESPHPAQPQSPGRKRSRLNLRKTRLRPFSAPLAPQPCPSHPLPKVQSFLLLARRSVLFFDISTHCEMMITLNLMDTAFHPHPPL